MILVSMGLKPIEIRFHHKSWEEVLFHDVCSGLSAEYLTELGNRTNGFVVREDRSCDNLRLQGWKRITMAVLDSERSQRMDAVDFLQVWKLFKD